MSTVNLIYLGILSDRIAILPPFAPFDHVQASAGILHFGDVFNLPFARNKLRLSVVEWSDVKDTAASSNSSGERESLGCWSTWAASNLHERKPRQADALTSRLGFDVSYTPVPLNTRRSSEDDSYDWFLLFNPISSLIYTDVSAPREDASFPNSKGEPLPPDEHLSCFDLMYFTVAGPNDSGWESRWSPAWRFVGQYMRFTSSVVDIAKGYVRRALGVEHDTPFISVHVRHGDFQVSCEKNPNCFSPLSMYVDMVKEVQEELYIKHGIRISDEHVIMTSDETNLSFWNEVDSLGWRHIDHTKENTMDLYGEWYMTLVEVVVQSLSLGFVGTGRSTLSTVSQKRVEDWNNGTTRIVPFVPWL
ncbi:uncharacterized protein BT62DRAFT_755789 [Guyanagaster necrorhizus]|uniref:O-fucosyltransferase family protein n=1 Tax=Guyanagaster necrorhizus TaxID=856835 RepID=A0A9P8AU61_9AGAR|nr:uncharacterized protein BT62DRAFT_755789 [Guyanagaster necrorhizus MCA 3950]KAG7448143.1 hypothetical protein BT62DRAFT_755789 [Guyanagaster necrorhizus MCA 3950]